MARGDKIRLASAAISGIAMACVQVHRIDEAQALEEIAKELAGIPANRRQEVLDQAASLYVRPLATDVYYPELAALLERAGADLETAGRLRDARGGRHI